MAKAETKVLGLLPRSLATTLLLGLAATVIVALIWSWVMAQSFSYENAWVTIIELLLLAVIIGWIVGVLANNENASTLLIAAGLAITGLVLTQALISYAGAAIDQALASALHAEAFGLSVSVGQIVLAIVAAAAAASASRTKDMAKK